MQSCDQLDDTTRLLDLLPVQNDEYSEQAAVTGITHSAFRETKRAFTMKGSLGNLLAILYLIIGSSEGTKSYSLSVTQDLGVSVLEDVDNRNDSRALGQTLLLSCGNKRPELVDVDDGAPLEVAGEVEAAHTDLTEVTGVVLIEVGPTHGKLSIGRGRCHGLYAFEGERNK